MNDVYKFIENLDINSEYIVVAVSGGPDSMLLLKVLIDLQNKINKKIVVAHVHHNLRPESDYEADMVKKYCENNNIIFEMFKIEKYPNNKFSEESARVIRYDFFDRVIKKYNSDILFTAHHGDDLVETVLMRLTRGSSIKGYSGFGKLSNNRGYIIARPLIFLTKEEILEEINKNGLWYANDLSNKSDKYKRNRIRNNVLPLLKKENKNVHTKFIEFSERLINIDEYFKDKINTIKDDIIIDNTIYLDKFNKLDGIIQLYLIEYYLDSIYCNDITNITNIHKNLIFDSIKKINTKFSLPLNKIGIVEYNTFKIVDNCNSDYYDIQFTDKVVLSNNKIIEIDNNTTDGSNYVIHLNSKDIKLPFHVRCKKDGDYMYVKNMNGKKSISNIFTDSKILKENRNTYPIVTDDNDVIIWIPGIKKSNLDRKKDGKYDIILRYH